MKNEESGRRRESFDAVAAYYNVYRSPYPQEVVDTVIALSHLHQGSRVLERGGTPGFFAETQPYYLKWGLADDLSFQPPAPDNVPTMYPELDQLPEFRCVERHHVEIPMSYSTASYIGWLHTDSLVNSLNDTSRRGFLQDIERLIASKYNGQVVRNCVYAVIVAQRAW